MERITAAAIKWRRKGDEDYQIITGHNHACCIETFSFMEILAKDRDLENEKQGFVTSENRFVDRREALTIAKEAGQLKEGYDKDWLDSYAINW